MVRHVCIGAAGERHMHLAMHGHVRAYTLEEGHRATARTVGSALIDYAHEHWPIKTYACAWTCLALAVWVRDATGGLDMASSASASAPAPPPPPPPPPPPIPNPAELAGLYAHMPSTWYHPTDDWASMRRVDGEDTDRRRLPTTLDALVDVLRRTSARYNYTCLAAVHVGVPVRVAWVHNGSWIFINPVAVTVGSRVSRAYETSAFYPGKPPVKKTRFFPVSVRAGTVASPTTRTLVDVTDRGDAHCVLHLLDQFEGTTPYDTVERR